MADSSTLFIQQVSIHSKIFLIGFMGSGKSTIGKRLAKKLGYEFIDLDSYIEHHESTTITHLFEQRGEEYFRKLESELLISFATKNNVIISCGGGTPCYNNNMEWMLTNGHVVYLEANAKTLAHRLKNGLLERPLLKGVTEDTLPEFIEKKLEERVPFYLKAHQKVNIIDLSI